jgi:hypothetical protein
VHALSRWATLLALTALLCGLCACSRQPSAEPPEAARSPEGAAPAGGKPPPASSGVSASAQRAGSPGRVAGPDAEVAPSGELSPGVETPPPGNGVSSAEIGPSREILLRRQDNPSTAPAASTTPATPLETEEQALLALPAAAVLPEDFRIGGLADLLQSDNPARGIAAVARSFLDALVRGDVDSDLIEPGRREDLSRSLAYYLSTGDRPDAFRLGAVETAEGDPDEAWLNVRLFGSPGRTEGELYLRRTSQRWYVLDLQAELAGLQQPYTRAEDRFYPSVYAWGLE